MLSSSGEFQYFFPLDVCVCTRVQDADGGRDEPEFLF